MYIRAAMRIQRAWRGRGARGLLRGVQAYIKRGGPGRHATPPPPPPPPLTTTTTTTTTTPTTTAAATTTTAATTTAAAATTMTTTTASAAASAPRHAVGASRAISPPRAASRPSLGKKVSFGRPATPDKAGRSPATSPAALAAPRTPKASTGTKTKTKASPTASASADGAAAAAASASASQAFSLTAPAADDFFEFASSQFARGERVRHPEHGLGTVREIMSDGRTMVRFDSGEVRCCHARPPYHSLPTAYCLLPTAYCLLPTAYCLLPT